MKLLTVEGNVHDGIIEVRETPPGMEESKVLVTFLKPASEQHQAESRMISLGMFEGENKSTEDDFKTAESP